MLRDCGGDSDSRETLRPSLDCHVLARGALRAIAILR